MRTAQQKKERKRLIGIVIFIALVIVSGLALTAAGKTEDPFQNMSDIVDMRLMLSQTGQTDSLPSVDGPADGGLALPPTTSPNPNPGIVITWSAAVEVLYDLWFICAASAVVIVLDYLYRWLVKPLSRRNRPTPASRPRGGNPPAL